MRTRTFITFLGLLATMGACAMEIEEEGIDPELEELESVGPNLLDNPGFQLDVSTSRCPVGTYPLPWFCERTSNWGLHGAGALRVEGGLFGSKYSLSMRHTLGS